MFNESAYLFPENETESHVGDGHEVKNSIIKMVAHLAFVGSVRSDLAAHGALSDRVLRGYDEEQ